MVARAKAGSRTASAWKSGKWWFAGVNYGDFMLIYGDLVGCMVILWDLMGFMVLLWDLMGFSGI